MGLNLNLKTVFTNYKKIDEYISHVPNAGTLLIIYDSAKKYDVPFYVLLGIYIIETKNRTIVYRLVEYIATITSGIFSFILKTRMKNYTVGVCQVGLGNILLLKFNQDKRYSKYIIINNFNEYKTIIKVFNKNNNIELAAMLINECLIESKSLSAFRQIRYIGQKYNGRIEYGILLSKLVQALEKSNIKEIPISRSKSK